MASIIARSSYDYWLAKVTTPGDWGTYLNSNAAINYANLPKWAALSFTSALSGYSQGQAEAASIAGNGVFNDAGRFLGSPLSLAASIGVTAGKIIFQWAQRPVKSNGC